jgi:radical SAM enzyme (rSAM/lipoprotein system)
MPGHRYLREKLDFFLYRQFRKNEAKLHELRYLFWECTLRCSLDCLHCGSDCTANSEFPDMPFEDFHKVLVSISNYYNPKDILIAITGGEPLMRKDLAFCGNSISRMGYKWGIVTNGMGYSLARHNELINAGLNSLTLSLDGLESNHNWLRNNNYSFARAVDALDIIKSSSFLNYDVVTCVNRHNINELYALKEFLESSGVKAWRLFTIAPIGRAKNNMELLLTPAELRKLMDFIEINRQQSIMKIQFSCEAYVGKYENRVRDGLFFCRAGVHIGSVLIDGSVSACPNNSRSFIQGNIHKEDFMDIWLNRFQIMRDRNWTNKYICENCKEYRWCQGSGLHLWTEPNGELLQCHCKMIEE